MPRRTIILLIIVIVIIGIVSGVFYSYTIGSQIRNADDAQKLGDSKNTNNDSEEKNLSNSTVVESSEVFSFSNSKTNSNLDTDSNNISTANKSEENSISKYKIIDLKIPKANLVLSTELADTQELQRQGLSGREGLDIDKAMLFVFPMSGYHSFWMKDMNFAIDIIWINESKEIVHIESNLKPSSYPKTFEPESSAKYVLETKAGLMKSKGIKVGDKVEFDI